jgi:hypothetical protein
VPRRPAGLPADSEAIAQQRLGGFQIASLQQDDTEVGLVGGDGGVRRAQLAASVL